MCTKEISVIIPAYKPDDKLLTTVRELVKEGFLDIIVVNDGSGEAFEPVFEEVKSIPVCTVLEHSVNRGKGAALKTAMQYILQNRTQTCCVVTADADGQHLPKDIKGVALEAGKQGKVVFGVRDFSDPKVPPRSKAGNKITSMVFRGFFGMKLQDTQTGLRAFPVKYLADMMQVAGDRYEYETNMLIFINRKNIPYEQVNIETVYLNDNQSSHFRAVRDSVRVYAFILKYLFSSAAAAVVDELAFYVFKKLAFLTFLPIPLTVTSAFFARVISSLMNFWLNSRLVFGEGVNKISLIKYYILAVVQIAVSAILVLVVERVLHLSSPALSTLAKTIIDTTLFFFSFRIQHKWVFNNATTNNEE